MCAIRCAVLDRGVLSTSLQNVGEGGVEEVIDRFAEAAG